MIFVIASIALLVSMILVMIRVVKGPSLYDRALSVNNFGTITVLFMAVFGFLIDRPEFLDIALVYSLINFVTLIAFLKYFELGDIASIKQENRDSQ